MVSRVSRETYAAEKGVLVPEEVELTHVERAVDLLDASRIFTLLLVENKARNACHA